MLLLISSLFVLTILVSRTVVMLILILHAVETVRMRL